MEQYFSNHRLSIATLKLRDNDNNSAYSSLKISNESRPANPPRKSQHQWARDQANHYRYDPQPEMTPKRFVNAYIFAVTPWLIDKHLATLVE